MMEGERTECIMVEIGRVEKSMSKQMKKKLNIRLKVDFETNELLLIGLLQRITKEINLDLSLNTQYFSISSGGKE